MALRAGLIGGLMLAASVTQADVVSVGGAVVYSDVPSNIELGQWESDSAVRLWKESLLVLPEDIEPGHTQPGTTVDFPSDQVSGIVPAGTRVLTLMLRVDPIGSGPVTLGGWVVLNRPILGVYFGTQLVTTDSLLGRPGVAYNENEERGLELDSVALDAFQISADAKRIDFVFGTGEFTDDIRLVVQADCDADLAPPSGTLDFFDLSEFLNAFDAERPVADFAAPYAVWNFFDISAFLAAYNAGCP